MEAIATPIRKRISKQITTKKVPDYLVKDEIDGVRFYYRDYKLVLNKRKTLDEIMGCSAIQWIIIEYLLEVIYGSDIRKTYRVATNESGNNLSLNNNFSFDLALYERALLTPETINNKYVHGIAPQIVVEIDTDISLDDTGLDTFEGYYFSKTQKLLAYGTQKIVWIFTKSKKILIAEGKDWHIYDFDKTLQLLDNVTFNIAEFLEKEKIVL